MILITEINITNLLVYAINNMLSNLLSSLNNNITSYLDDLVFIDSNITNNLTNIIGENSFSGIILICNSLIYGFLIYYAISYFLSHLTFSQVETPTQFIFKLLLCSFALNASQPICNGIIFLISHISNIIRELGNSLFDTNISFLTLINNILSQEYFLSNSFSLFSFDRNIKSCNKLWLFKFICFIRYSFYYY